MNVLELLQADRSCGVYLRPAFGPRETFVSERFATKDCWSLGAGRAITVAGTPERGVVVAKMKELIDLARRNGYRRDEMLAMMERMA
jgi:hypothetical protein